MPNAHIVSLGAVPFIDLPASQDDDPADLWRKERARLFKKGGEGLRYLPNKCSGLWRVEIDVI
jgi:hypothetical protein